MENFTLFSEHKAWLVKIIGQNHEFLGVNNAIASVLAIREGSAGLRPAEGGARLPTSRLAGTLAPPTSSDVLRLTEPRSTANPNGIGVFWQMQGSGKSFPMVFFAQKVLREVAGNRWCNVQPDPPPAAGHPPDLARLKPPGNQC